MTELEISSSVCESGLSPWWELTCRFTGLRDRWVSLSTIPRPCRCSPSTGGRGGHPCSRGTRPGRRVRTPSWEPCSHHWIRGRTSMSGFQRLHPQGWLSSQWLLGSPLCALQDWNPRFCQVSLGGRLPRSPGRATRPLMEDFRAQFGQTEGRGCHSTSPAVLSTWQGAPRVEAAQFHAHTHESLPHKGATPATNSDELMWTWTSTTGTVVLLWCNMYCLSLDVQTKAPSGGFFSSSVPIQYPVKAPHTRPVLPSVTN